MRINYNVFLIFAFCMLIITGCQTVSKKIDKSVTEEEKVLSRFLNKTSEELRIEFGKPDRVENTRTGNKIFVYHKSRLKIKCERIFEINNNNKVVGYTSKNCF